MSNLFKKNLLIVVLNLILVMSFMPLEKIFAFGVIAGGEQVNTAPYMTGIPGGIDLFGGGGGTGGGGGLSIEDLIAIKLAIVDQYFQEGNIDFEAALIKYGGEGLIERMQATTPKYQEFIDYMNDSENARVVRENVDTLIPVETNSALPPDEMLPGENETVNWNMQTASGTSAIYSKDYYMSMGYDEEAAQKLADNYANNQTTYGGTPLPTGGSTAPNYDAAETLINDYKSNGGTLDPNGKQKLYDRLGVYGFTYSEETGQLYETTGLVKNTDGTINWSKSKVATGGSSFYDANSNLWWATEGACLNGFMEGVPTVSGAPAGGYGIPEEDEDDSEDSSTTSGTANVVCTSYTYGEWGACGGGVQARSILHQYPSGCSDTSSAVLTQNCTMPSNACTSYTYSGWSACGGGVQSRTIANQYPTGCTDTSSAVLTQNCTMPANACTSYTYSNWSVCVGGTQILTKSPSGCTDTASAVFTQSCVAPESPIVTNATNAVHYISNPILSVITDRPSVCQYNENGGFTYPAGTTFDTTGFYNHNAQLPSLPNGAKTYYVVCKDNATGGISDALKIEFTIDVNTAPSIMSVTPATQTGSSPILGVTTDVPAICQYKQGADFTYGAGFALPAKDEGKYAHEISISSFADNNYVFYVVCKNIGTAAVSASEQISTLLDRSNSNPSAPVITNKTNSYQTVNNPVLSVDTNKAAICQYSQAIFTYGNGTQFAVTGTTGHSAQLFNLANGQHAYYVICQAIENGIASDSGYQIIFNVNAGTSQNCANLSSNDRLNDNNRSQTGVNQDSLYMWQSMETGARESFSNVDWYAGYQFTVESDGQITELCGYFEDGTTNKVSLYNGSYVELAGAEITGNGGWECAPVASAEVVADGRYYIIARVKDNPIYFEYKSGMLPRQSGKAIIEAGIRQTIIDGVFKTDIIKYDYMVFGLVDAKISFVDEYLTGPQITSTYPSGTIYDSSTDIGAQTEDNAVCRFSRDDVDYADMSYTFAAASNGALRQKVCDLENGTHTFYVRCKNASGVENNRSTVIQFEVSR